jgi:hypothetical protein
MSYIGNQPTSVAFLTDQFSGTGSQTAFTLSAAPANTASIIVAVSGVLQDPTTYSTSGLTLTFSAAPPSGTGNISVRFLGIPASNIATTAYRTQTEFTATAGQTTFSVPSYTPGYIDVYRNGVLLGSADFTATNGTTVVLASGATAGDLVETISFFVSSVLNAIPAVAGAVSSAYLTPSLSLVTPSVTTTLGVGGATPAASGAGITFPATQSSSADANTLDDYEEGTWTPNDSSGAGLVLTASGGRYVKVGRFVQFWFRAQYPSTSNTSNAVIGGLPYAAQSGGAGSLDIAGSWNTNFSQNFNNSLSGFVVNGSTLMTIYSLASSQANALTNANVSTFNIYAFGSYYAAA